MQSNTSDSFLNITYRQYNIEATKYIVTTMFSLVLADQMSRDSA
jgi:hypothetical protein